MLDVSEVGNFLLDTVEPCHAEVGRVADRTGCKRISANADDEVTLKSCPLGALKKGAVCCVLSVQRRAGRSHAYALAHCSRAREWGRPRNEEAHCSKA
eukprot:6210097-Pleurochrysis_carterae.AAC.1